MIRDNKNGKNQGITLVALIITIIILIILAAVTIKILYNEDFIWIATKATEKYSEEQYKEKEMFDELNDKIKEKNNYDGPVFIKLKQEEIELIGFLNNEPIKGNNGNEEKEQREFQIEIEEKPEDAQVIWSSSNEHIVSVDKNGKVTLVGTGEAIITATVKNIKGEEATSTCKVNTIEKLYLYYYGNEFKNITGGYEKIARTDRTFSASFNEDNIYINCYAGYGGGGVFTTNAIDLYDFEYLKSYGDLPGWATSDSGGRKLYASQTKTWGSGPDPTGAVAGTETGMTAGKRVLTANVLSLDKGYYIVNGFNQSHGYIYATWLEKKPIKLDVKLKQDKIELANILNDEPVKGNNGNEEKTQTEFQIEIEKQVEVEEIIWNSSNEEVATVSKTGKVTYVNPGTATITCTAKDKLGNEVVDTCEVKMAEKLYLYYYGNEFKSITGGYEKIARTGRTFSATFNEDNIYINCYASYGGGGVFTANTIDLKNFKYLNSYGDLPGWATSDSGGRKLYASQTKTWGSGVDPTGVVAWAGTGMTTGKRVLTANVLSLDKGYYIVNGFNQSHGYIYATWLENS